MGEDLCPYTAIRKRDLKTIIINCRGCDQGNSTIFDETCRSNLLKILQTEHGINKIILNHAFVKVFQEKGLELLKGLANFAESMTMYGTLKIPSEDEEKCRSCIAQKKRGANAAISMAQIDPIKALQLLQKMRSRKQQTGTNCQSCEKRFDELLEEMISKANLTKQTIISQKNSDEFYTMYIRPYVRPGFIDSYIQLNPPPDAVFFESYEVQRKRGRPIAISLYTLKTRPEKLYFVIPPEYDLPREELYLLEKVRLYLSRHRPKDASFMDAETAREYFHRFGRQVITRFVEDKQLSIGTARIDYLADIFARYTAGFGILEDLLSDARIQDIYVNAPVTNNALHLVVDGEEYTSNVYLSVGDIDALSSRFRTLSGRAFSEASPVLDMDLERYHTRVAAISNPLTPRGIAFALRKHRQKPWTLPHFIANQMISAEAAGLLSFLIDGQASLLVAGSRGSGKTSLLSSLILEIPQRFRILTIEDTAEIPVDILQRYGYKIQSLLTKSIASGSGSAEVDPTDALRTALRLGESVLVLGEVRGIEARVLFEAMRVGAAGNLIMGTIHGSTTRDVYERVVYDIGIPATSFKAVDSVIIAAPIRSEGGIERKRRVTQISEIAKSSWMLNPDPDSVFQDIMIYNTSKDELTPTSLLDMGQSEVIENIASKWGITVEKAIENIKLRTEIKKTIAEQGKENQELLEAPATRDTNNAFWMFLEEEKVKHGEVHYNEVKRRWMKWFNDYAGRTTL